MATICHFCGNQNFTRRHVQYTYRRDGNFLIVNEVPCEQCDYCGEQYFPASVLKSIEQEFEAIYRRGKTVKRELRVPIEQFGELVATG
jgi:YgiT-type zinc finger domain-containing protein